MELLRVSENEIDTNEENPYLDAVYRGRPFTGAARDQLGIGPYNQQRG